MVEACGTIIGRRNAQERVPVLRDVDRVRIVGVTEGQATIEEFAPEHVVLRVALTVAQDEPAVGGLLEAHHDPGLVGLLGVVHVVVGHQVPTHRARRVDDRVFRTERPFQRPAHRVVPDHAGRIGRRANDVVDEVETILEGGIRLFNLHVEGRVALRSDPPPHGGFLIQRRHADKIEVLSGTVSSTGITSARSGPSFTEDGFAFFVRRSFFLVFGL